MAGIPGRSPGGTPLGDLPGGSPVGIPWGSPRGTPGDDLWIFSLRSGARIMRACTTSVDGALPYGIEKQNKYAWVCLKRIGKALSLDGLSIVRYPQNQPMTFPATPCLRASCGAFPVTPCLRVSCRTLSAIGFPFLFGSKRLICCLVI